MVRALAHLVPSPPTRQRPAGPRVSNLSHKLRNRRPCVGLEHVQAPGPNSCSQLGRFKTNTGINTPWVLPLPLRLHVRHVAVLPRVLLAKPLAFAAKSAQGTKNGLPDAAQFCADHLAARNGEMVSQVPLNR